VHLPGIKYPDLDQASRLTIWRSFLHMAKVEILDHESDLAATATDGKSRMLVKDLEKLAEKAFNGVSFLVSIGSCFLICWHGV
jgi:hypothetical protein